ncbi:hypothetical protein [Maribacter algarum]|uniref:hypothetical protein n=1 Tax=Maribacter algarum (ex Zhang et al. 2020) TaxID=2578118 RepID=UPI00110BC0FD|nr:hypothetical protein [Maribacter algarum]
MVRKSIIDSAVSSIQIDVSNCFEVKIETFDTQAIVVEANIDGEYRKDLVLNMTEEGTTVLVSAGFRPNFENPNDKLSAHKVVSIALNIKIPQNMNVRVFGSNCNVNATGYFEKLKMTLNDGVSRLYKVEGLAEITSQSGDIFVESKSAEILPHSKYGQVDENQIPSGDNKYLLNSVTGDIRFKRIE